MYAAFSKFARSLLARKREILIVGPRGAGKTSLVGVLAGSPDGEPLQFDSSRETVMTVGVMGTDPVAFLDVPDVGRLQKLSRLSPIGVIVVVANGFYEARTPSGGKLGDVMARIEHHRHAELIYMREDVSKCLDLIDNSGAKIDWILTVVNKADLWWDQRAQVDEYYRQGFRRTLLEVMKKHRCTNEAMPITGCMSCRIQRFNRCILPSAKFDDDESFRLKDDIVRKLKSAVSHSVSGK